MDSVDGHVGLLVTDPSSGYIAGTVTSGGSISLETFGRITDAACAVSVSLTWDAFAATLGRVC